MILLSGKSELSKGKYLEKHSIFKLGCCSLRLLSANNIQTSLPVWPVELNNWRTMQNISANPSLLVSTGFTSSHRNWCTTTTAGRTCFQTQSAEKAENVKAKKLRGGNILPFSDEWGEWIRESGALRLELQLSFSKDSQRFDNRTKHIFKTFEHILKTFENIWLFDRTKHILKTFENTWQLFKRFPKIW